MNNNKQIKKISVDAKKTLDEFKKKIDPELEAYFSRMISENNKKDKRIGDAIEYARDITMSGGKRARAAFMYFGYLAAGGKNLKEITKTSISIELIHAFLLVHDDIIDKDALRHGVKTIHTRYSELAKKYFKNKDADHFGNSMAIIMGDMLSSFGGQVIFESKFSPNLVIKALHKMQKIVFYTIIGQAKDIYIENCGEASEKDILEMYENKTAKYTLEGPLHLGAVLGGADERILDALTSYALPAGIAFQIQDDILGVFGKVEKVGKPIGSDVRQGKQTILVAKALELATKKEKYALKKYLGKKDLSLEELEDFKAVICNTGSLDYAKNLAIKLIKKAQKEIVGADIDKQSKDFLFGMADYMLNREV